MLRHFFVPHAIVSACDLAEECVHTTNRQDDDTRKAVSMC